MLQHTLREWRDKRFWILLFLSLAALLCVYRITNPPLDAPGLLGGGKRARRQASFRLPKVRNGGTVRA